MARMSQTVPAPEHLPQAKQHAKGFMTYCQGVFECCFRGKHGVREAATFAQGHTASQCPRPSWGPGLPDSRDVLEAQVLEVVEKCRG